MHIVHRDSKETPSQAKLSTQNQTIVISFNGKNTLTALMFSYISCSTLDNNDNTWAKDCDSNLQHFRVFIIARVKLPYSSNLPLLFS